MGTSPEQRSGAWAEDWALGQLEAAGWRLVSRNWRCRWGELDLLVAKPGRLLLVEVKGRSRAGADGWGAAALGFSKRQRLLRAWLCWQADHPEWSGAQLEWVAALVPLPPALGPVRWFRLE
ncbi:YraN family protein [Cyanobium sp. Morenito 9A2]|uniref:YraN family protein n=1 Tax=Cyanobium sp. Morenito 9A2 TaxID=2823718 RepID=UPI0020CB75A7|nr:YraN family protein [Cyanobium sp. Morenito 9A2]MCP9850492.1 YraN family protein [Cyanobium sp. Morenito 9A2]